MSLSTGRKPKAAEGGEGVPLRDLQILFTRHKLQTGEPRDVIELAARMKEDEPLRDEIARLLRATVRAGNERPSRGELMRLIVVAAGGPTVSPNMTELGSALWQVAGWVNTVSMPSENGSSYAQPEQSVEASGVPVSVVEAELASRINEPAGAGQEARPPVGLSGSAVLKRWRQRGSGFLGAIGSIAKRASAPKGAVRARRSTLGAKERGWVLPALVFLAAAGVLVYLMWPASPRAVALRYEGGASKAGASPGIASRPPAASPGAERMCLGPIRAGVSRAGIEERSLWAHKLLDQKLYPVAFSQLRGLEAVDPGYPGVALQESEALVRMGQLDGARAAIETQERVSACLASLPSAAVDAYCGQEFSPADVAGCRPAMAQIQAATEVQAALVHLQLANRMHPDGRSMTALADLTKGEAGSLGQESPGESIDPWTTADLRPEEMPEADPGRGGRPRRHRHRGRRASSPRD